MNILGRGDKLLVQEVFPKKSVGNVLPALWLLGGCIILVIL